ncbi:response regulator transcription factor [Dehalogenimonas etheniformans]|uniref:DNA-binding response regulator n=1 Tax=Dehalogenimonas etheniformans TaxID=1536648 RepID=A0A2P5P7Y9_9CHLR|nr:response regulator transcription factor [Dehalogenimonas etheniformans]PPD58411.1 DNA-binding response regulator [Dehalogenimonas etheniformans]QNT76984.1 response regulator transcription factor [Dehalogenimonas etheniformans]
MNILLLEPVKSDIEAIGSIFNMCVPGVILVNVATGNAGLVSFEQQPPDLVILDLAIPDVDSFEMIKAIRLYSSVPLIVIDIDHDESSLIRSIEFGADDYISKPIHPLELLARAKSILRRSRGVNQDQYIVAGLLRLDASLHRVHVGDKEVRLTRTENIILRHLMENAGNIVTYSNLAHKIWGDDWTESSATIRVYIDRIRKKLGNDSKSPSMIVTETGLGYRLVKPIS